MNAIVFLLSFFGIVYGLIVGRHSEVVAIVFLAFAYLVLARPRA